MVVILIFVCIVIIVLAANRKKDINEEERTALKTPGLANKLREDYGEVLDLIMQTEGHSILLERDYDQSIRIKNLKNQELFMSYSSLGVHGPELRVVCIQDSQVLKKWIFDKRSTSASIYQEIINYFN